MNKLKPVTAVAAALVLPLTVAAPAAPVPKPPPPLTEAELREKVYGDWVEVAGGKEAGKPVPGFRAGWKLDPDEPLTWDKGLSLGPYWRLEVNTAVVPWRMDLIDRSPMTRTTFRVSVQPGIIRRDGDTLVWVASDRWFPHSKTGDYAGRPQEFTSTPENKYVLRVLKRCKHLQTQFEEDKR